MAQIHKYTFLFFLLACSKPQEINLNFSLRDETLTGISFNNEIVENDSLNFYFNEYIYIGAGVGLGDFNNDGLQDVFFAGSQVESKLYINLGDFKFKDISLEAGILNTEWITGVSVVDVNQDGFQDIYLCVSHFKNPESRKNLLFVNQGGNELAFKEEAVSYGLADTGFSSNAGFLDFDKDGDLDMYLLNHKLFDDQPNNIVPIDSSGKSLSADKFYRNEGFSEQLGHPVFKEVSAEIGIKEDGYGLGLVISDFNQDNYPDIYVANDYLSNDYLWINDTNGGFVNKINAATRHQSFSSMGIDAADLNNDLLPDIGVLDMMPFSNERKKMMNLGFTPENYDLQRKAGYNHQFSRNVLQIHQGFDEHGSPLFSEVGHLSGIAETDWSWSILFADFDNDGWKDIHISNGLSRDITNNDFISFTRNDASKNAFFGGQDTKDASADQIRYWTESLNSHGEVKPSNFLFKNKGTLLFEDLSKSSGISRPSVSHGTAYGDLDNDGDLDLVVNNMNQKAFVYQNNLRKSENDSTQNYLKIRLKGEAGNLDGFGAKAIVSTNTGNQSAEVSPIRGYASSVDSRLHFGLGEIKVIDSVKILWPSGKVSFMESVASNQILLIEEAKAKFGNEFYDSQKKGKLFEQIAGLNFQHKENHIFDYYVRRIQPQKYSQLGPCIEVGDVNGDGLEDVFVGGSRGQLSVVFIQKNDGGFEEYLLSGSKEKEDLDATFFDVDKDGDLDLLVCGGSTEFSDNSQQKPRLLLNDGKGNFSLKENAFDPELRSFSSTMTLSDFDGDGDLDVFMGGRVRGKDFPALPSSYLLLNDNGQFKDVTNDVSEDLSGIGMVTDALWLDFDRDGLEDLVVCGDLMAIEFFRNAGGRLERVTSSVFPEKNNGIWRSMELADMDGDGDLDIVAGNFGLNNKYQVSDKRPYYLFAKDINQNGFKELMPAYYMPNSDGDFKAYPDLSMDQFAQQTPLIKQKYHLYNEYSKASVHEIIPIFGKPGPQILHCDYMKSAWFENTESGPFIRHELPLEAQWSPVNAMLFEDFDGDGLKDLLLAGNEFQLEVSTGRADASYGVLLKNKGQGFFENIPSRSTGLFLKGDVKSMAMIRNSGKKKILLSGANEELLRTYKFDN